MIAQTDEGRRTEIWPGRRLPKDIRAGDHPCEPSPRTLFEIRQAAKPYGMGLIPVAAPSCGCPLEPGERLVKDPYVAEALPVSVDGQYVVVEA